jgi:superfamily I DNA and RNA helicase
LPAVRAVGSAEGLGELGEHLPAEAAEALSWLAEGIPVEEIREALATAPSKEKVDPENLEKALEKPDSKRRFARIESPEDLAGMFHAPLEKWRVFLHPSQERLVKRHLNGPGRALGGAGTGKTVVAMHRARHLAAEVFPESSDRVLFTTFTANLAHTIEKLMTTLCGQELERIEVVHLHSWAVRFMRTQGVNYDVASEKVRNDC